LRRSLRLPNHLVLLFALLALVSLLMGAGSASAATPSSPTVTTATCGKPVCTWDAFGPKKYVRPAREPEGRGHDRDDDRDERPSVFTDNFSVQNTATKYTLHIVADEDARPVIFLNGKQVLDEDDFREHRGEREGHRDERDREQHSETVTVDRAVSLKLSNTLTVRLEGKPGSGITVTVIGVDNDFPIISAVGSPAADSFNWNNTNVLVTFTCSDKTSGVAFCPAPVTVSNEGANQVVSGTATDRAGNSATASVTINLDKTPPSIAATPVPAANSFGWNSTSVIVNFLCTDALSGIATCSSPVTLSKEGARQIVTGSATDRAGNSSSTTATINIDEAPPAITAIASPGPNAAGWNNSDVTVSFTCADALSGIAICPQSQVVNTEGTNQTASGTAFDKAGNSATASATVKIDKTPPNIAITSPPNNFVVASAQATLQGVISDSLSGVSGVNCNGSPGIVTGGTFTCDVPLLRGSNLLTITGTDVAGNTVSTDLTLVRAIPINIQITAPAPLQLFSANPITVAGTVDHPNATVTVGNVTATVSGGTFTASGVVLREGKNLLTVSATSPDGGIGSDTTSVFLDTTPPVVHIDSPAGGAIVSTPQIDVTGNVNDLVTGTVNGDQVSVVVNGVTADVANRSFAAHNILLVPGANIITAVATDRAGNVSQHQVQVNLQQLAGQTLSILSGNNQIASINTALSQPLVVRAADSLGRPIANRALDFSVVKSDGSLISGQHQGRKLTVQTDLNGNASVQFKLGSRNGVGINQVAVNAPGFVGSVVFSADSTVGPATQIHTVSGEVQKGAVSTPLPEPLVAIVMDAGGNPVANVPVTFAVRSGGGLVAGQSTFTQNTDSDGKAFAVVVLGQQVGINNNVVAASFSGLTPGQAAVFTSSAVVPGPVSGTTISGVVLDDANNPIPNATASVKSTNLSALTDASGRFTIVNAPVGNLVLFIDGSTSTDVDSYPTLSFQMATIPGIDNTLPGPIYLPALDTSNSQVVGGDQDVILTMKNVPGVAYRVFAHSVTFPDGSHVGRLTLSQVHADKVPMTPPNGTSPRLVGTLQPSGVKFDPPIQMTLPNTDGLAPGQALEVFSFHHDVEQFVTEGTAHVSDDGSVVVCDPGFGLTVSGWHGSGPPPRPKTDPKKDPCKNAADDAQQIADDSQGFFNPTTEFADVQACIAKQSCGQKNQMENPDWLDGVLPKFVNALKNRTGAWPLVLAACNAIPITDLFRKQECAALMALNHISVDLLDAMVEVGCGTDADWQTLQDIIKQCLKNEDPLLEPITFPVTKFMRDVARGVCQSRRRNLGLPLDANP
jgi:hypothetical protein